MIRTGIGVADGSPRRVRTNRSHTATPIRRGLSRLAEQTCEILVTEDPVTEWSFTPQNKAATVEQPIGGAVAVDAEETLFRTAENVHN